VLQVLIIVHQTLSCIELRVCVNNQDLFAEVFSKGIGYVNGESCLADAALHVHEGDDLHWLATPAT
jgi:hypothetical protein